MLRNFGPVFVGRGVVQISAYVDTVLASLLPTGAVAGLSYAQVIYTLPVSLFGMAVSAAELPEMSAVARDHDDAVAAHLQKRLASAPIILSRLEVSCVRSGARSASAPERCDVSTRSRSKAGVSRVSSSKTRLEVERKGLAYLNPVFAWGATPE